MIITAAEWFIGALLIFGFINENKIIHFEERITASIKERFKKCI